MEASLWGISTWLWIGFAATVVVMLGIDMWSHHGDAQGGSHRKHLIWTIVWITVSLLFGAVLWVFLGSGPAQEYLASYAMEKGLSLDNLFLFYIIFQGLRIPKKHQHRVLFWGIIGAVIFRGLFIFLGIQALERWVGITYIFAAVLLYAAWKAFWEDPNEVQSEPRILAWLSSHLPVSTHRGDDRFWVIEKGRWAITPLLVALIAIELTDVMFAVDSVPAALAITHHKFIVYSSNIFAILGLRALYLYAAAKIANLRYLHYGLSAVLTFAGVKILTQEWVTVPPLLSAAFILTLIGISIVLSLRAQKNEESSLAPDQAAVNS